MANEKEQKEHQVRCQSCGQRIFPGYFGTEQDGSEAKEWCKMCYLNGAFTDPDMTLEKMIAASIRFMTHNLKFSDEQAEVLTHSVIPQLKRWRGGHGNGK